MQTSMAEWSAEIEIVKIQILRWLQSQSADEPLIQVIHKVEVSDAMVLGVSDTLWIYMVHGVGEGICEFDCDLESSDVWECAVAKALSQFRAG